MSGTDLRSVVERATQVIPGGTNAAARRPPGLGIVEFRAAKGSRLWDGDGREYTDYHAAFGPAVLGHGHEEVNAAAAATVRQLSLTGVGVTRVEVELAEKLVELVPSAERVVLTNSGTEATYHAIRLARAATGRRLLIKFQGCYHGWHDSVALNVISRASVLGTHDPLTDGILPAVLEATVVLPFNDLPAVQAVLEAHRDDVAAVILEPVQHNIGSVPPEPGFLEGLRELTTTAGVVLIFDEVVTGIRHDLGGYQRIAGVTPDLTTLGKALANGWPLGAVVGRAELMEVFNRGKRPSALLGGTYNGHPAVAGAARATLAVLERDGVHEKLYSLGDQVRGRLRDLFASRDVPAQVVGLGSIWAVYFQDHPARRYEDLVDSDGELLVELRLELMRHGVFEFPLNLKRSQVSFAHEQADVDHLIAATELSLEAVLSRRSAVT